jgi:anthranilate synthase component 1
MKEANINIISSIKQSLGDRLTPVEAYYRLRDYAVDPILMESSDYHSKEGSLSFLCIQPLAEFRLQNKEISMRYQGQMQQSFPLEKDMDITLILEKWKSSFQIQSEGELNDKLNGFFGYSAFEAVGTFEAIPFAEAKQEIPEIIYRFYRFVIVFDHFNHRIYFIENREEGQQAELIKLEKQLKIPANSHFHFKAAQERESNMSDEAFLKLVEKGKEHCHRGDVFQIVFSRAFFRDYEGDEFLLYRHLRAANPSPYLYFFDYSDFKIFGSSPEAHLVIEKNKAKIFPIAGTYRRTGDDLRDQERSKALAADPKENAEHVMLVDLARNDLNRFATDVEVANYREIQFFSHVIHLVSKVEGKVEPDLNPFKALAETFPAGTLSGAPKRRAVELIHEYENLERSFYGGCVGMINLNNEVNQAIIIRSILCKNGKLRYQAGAGIVIDSKAESELQEVENKVAALEYAIELANKA